MLLPWGIRHVRQSGELYFTDDHGGITALIGANPNSEGTYTRALNRMFKDVTGRSVLDEPHRETDRAAYAIAREWLRFEPRYALGLATLKADRLFDPEHRLLYWSIFRPGVLVGRPAALFAAPPRRASSRFADGFGLAVAGLALAGIVAAVARRRWAPAGAGPVSGSRSSRPTRSSSPSPATGCRSRCWRFRSSRSRSGEIVGALRARRSARRAPGSVGAAKVLGPALVLVVVWRVALAGVLDAGAGAARAASLGGDRGRRSTDGTRLCCGRRRRRSRRSRRSRERPKASTCASATAAADPRCALRLGGGPLPAGRYRAPLPPRAPEPRRGSRSRDSRPTSRPARPATFDAVIDHPGGPLTLDRCN